MGLIARSNVRKSRIDINPKVGGILTTNYDNLVEGSFGSKFGKGLLKPVGRVTSRETSQRKKVIPVYHIHGYVSYVPPEDDPQGVKASDMLVISQDDYFERFYDPLGFSNYIAMSFLRRFPSLFIGSAMKDLNIRRFLYHLRKERGDDVKTPNYFAILPATGTSQDYFMDNILEFYGVKTIWIEKFEEIGEILKQLYCSGHSRKNLEEEWNDLWRFKWSNPSPKTT